MFTGIIEEIGTVRHVRTGKNSCVLTISASKILSDLRIGDSVAVNGTCLTVCRFDAGGFSADVMPETMRRTNLGKLTPGSCVNLERAMPAGGRFGGHIVSGHVDGTGKILQFREEDNAVWVKISASPELLYYMIRKGSVAIDGISLTIAELSGEDFSVSVIPHTRQETTLLSKKAGEIVNLECDMIAKYLAKFQNSNPGESGEQKKSGSISRAFLAEHGYD